MNVDIKSLSAKQKLFVSIAVGCILLMVPFAINNFIQERVLLGVLSFLVIIVLFSNAIAIMFYQHYFPNIILFSLIPTTIIFLCFSINYQGITGVLWTFPAIFAVYIMLPEKKAWLANAVLLAFVLYFSYRNFDIGLFIRITATLGLTSIFSALFIHTIAEQQGNLENMAKTDALTGLLNRAQLDEMLDEAVIIAERTDSPMSLLTIDIDYFKKVNDDYGHAIGDTVLIDVARIISQGRRKVDKVLRIGGEEFLVLLYGTGNKSATRVAEDIREKIEASNILPKRTLTVSIGVAEIQKNESWRDWMRRSDAKLYMAKDAGRNRVIA